MPQFSYKPELLLVSNLNWCSAFGYTFRLSSLSLFIVWGGVEVSPVGCRLALLGDAKADADHGLVACRVLQARG